jgi:hypothetical protein
MDVKMFSRSLLEACNERDISKVRKLLDEGRVSVHDTTEEGESLLSLACSAGYYELAQVSGFYNYFLQQVSVRPFPAFSAMYRGRFYDNNFLRFLPIFSEKIGVFLKNQCYD